MESTIHDNIVAQIVINTIGAQAVERYRRQEISSHYADSITTSVQT